MLAPIRSRLLTATPVEEHGLLMPVPWIYIPAAVPGGTSYTETPTEQVGATDSVATIQAHAVEVTDTTGATDTVVPVEAGSSSETVIDTVDVTDTTGRTVAYKRTVTDAAGVTDTTTSAEVNAWQIEITDAAGVTDMVYPVERAPAAYTVTVTEPIGVCDRISGRSPSLTPRRTLAKPIKEALGDGWQVYTSPPKTVTAPAVVIRPADPYQSPYHITGAKGALWKFDVDLIAHYRLTGEALTILEETLMAITPVLPNDWRWVEFGAIGELNVGNRSHLKGTLSIAAPLEEGMVK
jgi:hypothetical protein